MKPFSTSEKNIIKELVHVKSSVKFYTFLSENYFTKDSKKALLILPQVKTVLLYLKKELSNDKANVEKEVKKIAELLSLISYLKENGYITVFLGSNPSQAIIREDFKLIPTKNSTVIKLSEDGLFVDRQSPERIYDSNNNEIFIAYNLGADCYKMVAENITGTFYVSQTLVELVDKDFKS